ncbi:MAG: recombination protein RecR [Pelagibacteraceae bacterium]|jgi:recombination protein RecR|nr:recombination protein RecR [Pelagibacteraceae bacterium]HJL58273.1 recombination mediator RecR [Alphaproteobacteria bacterium]MBO6466876.1 recombination protein RecR [Pelagibacteraceae bacterium]MBO6467311.1 recombination protein RecR [Pelagibacteraceae bacterium]MBO6469103.1 recombination protein RecR [Pelagibacteraceae bacterium]|tara:strand:- start:349 stop:945 length:597 start_codon:yes stop_codon:yes gene_type:complete
MTNSEIDKLINEISKLPGLGRRSAQRIVLYLLKNKERSLLPLVQSLQEANQKIINCEICGNIDTISPCSLCLDVKRDRQTICVVEDLSDLWTFERIGFYRGSYHVLGGSLSAINGIGTDDLNITKLIQRIKKQSVKEVILALSTTIEGQTTSHVIADKLESIEDLYVTRLAQGVPMGGEVHYLDENTLNAAFQSRKKI